MDFKKNTLLQKKTLQDFPSHLIETASPEIKQLILFLLEKIEQQSNELLMLKQENAE